MLSRRRHNWRAKHVLILTYLHKLSFPIRAAPERNLNNTVENKVIYGKLIFVFSSSLLVVQILYIHPGYNRSYVSVSIWLVFSALSFKIEFWVFCKFNFFDFLFRIQNKCFKFLTFGYDFHEIGFAHKFRLLSIHANCSANIFQKKSSKNFMDNLRNFTKKIEFTFCTITYMKDKLI